MEWIIAGDTSDRLVAKATTRHASAVKLRDSMAHMVLDSSANMDQWAVLIEGEDVDSCLALGMLAQMSDACSAWSCVVRSSVF